MKMMELKFQNEEKVKKELKAKNAALLQQQIELSQQSANLQKKLKETCEMMTQYEMELEKKIEELQTAHKERIQAIKDKIYYQD